MKRPGSMTPVEDSCGDYRRPAEVDGGNQNQPVGALRLDAPEGRRPPLDEWEKFSRNGCPYYFLREGSLPDCRDGRLGDARARAEWSPAGEAAHARKCVQQISTTVVTTGPGFP